MENAKRRAGVRSAETGASLLRALADAGGPVALSTLARAAGMSSAKAHRYLVSYLQAGLVVQAGAGAAYDLGPLAVRIGLAAVERFDVVRIAADRLEALRDATGATVMISLETDLGPTVARIALSPHPVTLAVRIGTTFPLETTATGRVFLAFGAQRDVAPALAPTLNEVRATGVARVDATFLVGVSAVSVPLLGPDRRLAAVLTAIGRSGDLDTAPDGAIVCELQAFARGVLAEPAAVD